MKRIVIIFMGIVALAACTPGTEAPKQDGIVISEAMIRTPMGGQTMTAGYFQITNHGNIDDALISVESPVAERVEMHKTETVNDSKVMRKQISIDIKAGETVEFKPGGLHLMLFGVKLENAQADAALTLKYKHAPDMTIIAELTDTVASHH